MWGLVWQRWRPWVTLRNAKIHFLITPKKSVVKLSRDVKKMGDILPVFMCWQGLLLSAPLQVFLVYKKWRKCRSCSWLTQSIFFSHVKTCLDRLITGWKCQFCRVVKTHFGCLEWIISADFIYRLVSYRRRHTNFHLLMTINNTFIAWYGIVINKTVF